MNKDMNHLKEDYTKKEMSVEQVAAMKAAMEKAKADQAKGKKVVMFRNCVATAAAVALAFIILPNTSGTVAYAMSQIPVLGKLVEVVTFRDYSYEDDRNHADVVVPELVAGEVPNPEDDLATKGMAGEAMIETQAAEEKEENMQKSVEEINAEIQEITGPFIEEFEANLEEEQGYQDLIVESEVVNTTEEYFTLKLNCYIGTASGTEWNYYYTIDLSTGERLALKDIFAEGADYVTPISENIKEQMREQMADDEMVYYWLEDEMEDLNFTSIQEDQSFYIDGEGNVVISFNEGDVAPMYMGVVEFVIPQEVIGNILK